MPLRVRRRKGTSFFWLVGTIEGRRIRESTGTDNPEHAEIKRAAREAELFKGAIAGVRPTVPFSQAAASYLKAETPGVSQTRHVNRLARILGTRPTRDIDQVDCDRARDALCSAAMKKSSIARTVVAPLTAILRHASRRKWCDMPHFEWPKEEKTTFSFFMPEQAVALIANAAPHLKPLFAFMLCTGARTGETLTLDWSDVDLQGHRVILWEHRTKTRSRRVVHLMPGALAALAALPHREGRVFRRDDGEPYEYHDGRQGNIRTGFTSAACRAGLPGHFKMAPKGRAGLARKFAPEHSPHDFRHTFATWHYAVHKDLLLLKQEVGWSSTAMAERYAHVMPAGHVRAICGIWGTRPPGDTMLTQRRANIRKL